MEGTNEILERGYLPKELPPPFTSSSFARHYQTLKPSAKEQSLCVRYSYSKYAWVRRTLGIPNPVHMVALADAVSTSWQAIVGHCGKSKISRTTPQLDTERAIAARRFFWLFTPSKKGDFHVR